MGSANCYPLILNIKVQGAPLIESLSKEDNFTLILLDYLFFYNFYF